MAKEVCLLARCGWEVSLACEVVGISEPRFHRLEHLVSSAGLIDFIPTPTEIEVATAAIRSGEIRLSDSSASRWRNRELMEMAIEGHHGRYELAGTIPDDIAELPAWFRE